MLLQQFSFVQHQGTAHQWQVTGKGGLSPQPAPITFQNINLMVGTNASGKSRIINALRTLADLVAGETKVSHLTVQAMGAVQYELTFAHGQSLIRYTLAFAGGQVANEVLVIDGQERLNRVAGRLWYEGLGQFLEFEPDPDVVSVTLRDKKQQSYFETLYRWGQHVVHYRFGTPLGRTIMLHEKKSDIKEHMPSLKDDEEVTAIFLRAQQQLGHTFVEQVKADMNTLGYQLSGIQVHKPTQLPLPGFVLCINEEGVANPVEQMDISQGMFRALSLVIQLNYALQAAQPSCILIDDIGEGLDYERSTALIQLIRNKVAGSQVQVVMTTNDRFVMNDVPLAHWMVVERQPGQSIVHNQANSPQVFEDFGYTGLNNFDFFTTGFYKDGFGKEEQ